MEKVINKYLAGGSGEGTLLEEVEGLTSSKHDEVGLKVEDGEERRGGKKKGRKGWAVSGSPCFALLPQCRARPMCTAAVQSVQCSAVLCSAFS